ncbi:ERI1 exoribonuclease 3-like isoform X1 [Hetaerina americana]|uniref:ERI1 exoribonuclease 3-like isoform X1 n=1 Tax=Hetaerina americana TaxID=62018 RepID=UPI003A7F2FEE
MHRNMTTSYRYWSNAHPFVSRRRIQKENICQKFDYFLIVDFEATCEKSTTINPQEIIEFPCLRLNAISLEIDSMFHQYVMPVHKPVLSPFCIDLTGILQEVLAGQPHFEKCMDLFHEWMVKECLLSTKFAFITCGDWDFKVMLPAQCRLSGIPVPHYMKQWINIKKTFGEATGIYGHGLMKMLRMLNLKHIGRHHSGIDDCRNIANIVKELARVHQFTINGGLTQGNRTHI